MRASKKSLIGSVTIVRANFFTKRKNIKKNDIFVIIMYDENT